MIKIFGLSHIGKERKDNQDSIFFQLKENKALLIVADGMGGHLSGETASSMAVHYLSKIIDKSFKNKKKEILEEVFQVNKNIFLKGHEEIYKGMGTTLTLLYLEDNDISIVSLGDSRVYLFKEELYQLTEDHTLTEQKYSLGLIDRSLVDTDVHRHILLKGLGLSEDCEADYFTTTLGTDSLFLLCSDGFYDLVSSEQITNLIKEEKNTEVLVQKMIDLANDQGGRDNISIILLDNRI